MTGRIAMVRSNLDDLPAVSMSAGYWLRTWDPDDEFTERTRWVRLAQAGFPDIFDDSPGIDPDKIIADVVNRMDFDPTGFCFVCLKGTNDPVASAFMRSNDILGNQGVGQLDWVMVTPWHRACGLGKLATGWVLYHMHKVGFTSVKLDSQDTAFRVPAINMYARTFGFKPVLRTGQEAEDYKVWYDFCIRHELWEIDLPPKPE